MHNIEYYLLNLQKEIINDLENIDTQKFNSDSWQREEGGGGLTRILQGGSIFEKAGVNFSHVTGHSMPVTATAHRPELAGRQFDAMGISMVIHPKNPYIPTMHANLRFFMAVAQDREPIWWFGGGFDLTPYYGFEEDCIYWHKTAKKACDPFGETIYNRFKQWCDEYFYIKHRHEARGIGGLFFDDLNQAGFGNFEKCFNFLQSVGSHLMPAYLPLVEKRKLLPYEDRQRAFQCYRRGRYAEFNLIYDRGTLFGLQSGGRIESILMSLPPVVNWIYDFKPGKDSPEEKLTTYFLKPRAWLDKDL